MPEIEPNTKPASILVVDDEPDHAEVMSESLARLGHKTEIANSLADAKSLLGRKRFDVIVTDLLMDGRRDGLEVLAASKELSPAPPVVLVTALNDVPTSKQAMSEGAFDYITKPLDLDSFRLQVGRAVQHARLQSQNQAMEAQLLDGGGFEGIIGKSGAMQRIVQTARLVAPSDRPVLIMGESGTGKELIARAIHNNSRRRKQRLVALNCAGLSESILEDELFGHVKGAFTGAQSDREGRFEHADGGSLFMDEIGDMPAAMQAKLLRVLENGEVVRLGSNEPIEVDVRLISATNRNLEQMVADRTFREDLYYRIKGVTITIPPLRDRREDIPLLIYYFLKQAAEEYGKPIEGLEPEVQQALISYGWPGNVRQLKNVIENMVVLAAGDTVGVDLLPAEIKPRHADVGDINSLAGISIEQAEKVLIRNTLKMTGGNREQAAKMLGIGERTLYRKIKEYDIGE
ncbi:MAG TPA: sigma-54 dependent transcriptional regulator [Tepidisphaeraceae bacterium]|nr:sigma-54 dependent transcriptional regulator [Tepidisphaeraceae bacterium]